MKHIGIAAVSAEGAALCYRTICAEGAMKLGRHAHPEISLHCYPLADYMKPTVAGDWLEMGRMLLRSAEKLRQAGADFAICPDNTAHQGLDLVREESPIPWLHIAEEVSDAAKQRGYRNVLVLGTKYLMEGPVYRQKLEAAGIQWAIPADDAREYINSAIFDELVNGRFERGTRADFARVIEEHAALGCDAVILGCTEIPLLIGERDSCLPTLDSTRILARAGLREACESQ
jgi:aspartate racemase